MREKAAFLGLRHSRIPAQQNRGVPLIAFDNKNLTAFIVPVSSDVMSAVSLAAGLVHRQGGAGQCIMGTTHTALGGGSSGLWDSHGVNS